MTIKPALSKLQTELLKLTPLEFEHSMARVISNILEQPIFVAKSGFQFGGDAGTAGQFDRYIRIECKRYKNSSRLSERELLGEIDQALIRDKQLEAWILITPKVINEQLAGTLVRHGNKNGVAVILMGWIEDRLGELSSVCMSNADCFPMNIRDKFPNELMIDAEINANVETLKKQLESWALGYEMLEAHAQKWLLNVWKKNPRREQR